MESDFYLRYYVGHKGKFGHEFLEFEFRPDGKRSSLHPELRLGWGAGGETGRPEKNETRAPRLRKGCFVSAPLVLSIHV